MALQNKITCFLNEFCFFLVSLRCIQLLLQMKKKIEMPFLLALLITNKYDKKKPDFFYEQVLIF